jgi:hypothetical protein
MDEGGAVKLTLANATEESVLEAAYILGDSPLVNKTVESPL